MTKFKISNEKEYKDDEEIRNTFKTHLTDKVTQIRTDRILRQEAKFLSARRVSAMNVGDIV